MGSGFPVLHLPLKVSHRAVSQLGQVECGRAAPLVAFPNTFLSHDDQLLACYFCHLVVSMACLGSQWLCMWRACPVLFFSGQAQLHFLWPYQALCFQNCYSATWGVELESSFPTSSQPKIMRKTIDQVKRSISPFSASLP